MNYKVKNKSVILGFLVVAILPLFYVIPLLIDDYTNLHFQIDKDLDIVSSHGHLLALVTIMISFSMISLMIRLPLRDGNFFTLPNLMMLFIAATLTLGYSINMTPIENKVFHWALGSKGAEYDHCLTQSGGRLARTQIFYSKGVLSCQKFKNAREFDLKNKN